jgi:undecaprenyl-diphosphatase
MESTDRRWSLRIGLAALAVFGWLAAGVARGHAFGFDMAIRNGMHSHASPALTAIMRFATVYGAPEWLSALALAVCLVQVLRGRARGLGPVALAVAGIALLDVGLKLAFHRARPAPFFDLPVPQSYSFPSGHALFAAFFFGLAAIRALQTLDPRWSRIAAAAAAAAGALLIGASRIYLGVHYPSDVLAGFAVGIACLAAFQRVLIYLTCQQDP